jgi:hypothetical protein
MGEEVLGIIDTGRWYELLFFTQTRIVVAKTTRGGLGFLGVIGIAVADYSRKKKSDELKKLSLESVLEADKRNFFIPYSSIQKVEMKKRRTVSQINIIVDQKLDRSMMKKKDKTTGKDVYWYERHFKKEKFEDHVNLVRSVLPDKVVVLQ